MAHSSSASSSHSYSAVRGPWRAGVTVLGLLALCLAIATAGQARAQSPAAAAAADVTPPKAIATHVEQVTVYPGWARVRRVGTVTLVPGVQRVRLDNVPTWIVPESAFATIKASDSAAVVDLNVARITGRDDSPDLLAAQAALRALEAQRDDQAAQTQVLLLERRYLEQLAANPLAVTLPSEEGTKPTVRSVEDLRQLRALFTTGLQENYQKVNDLQRQTDSLQPKISDAKALIEKLHRRDAASRLGIDVAIQATAAGTAELAVEYLVPGAAWEPLYVANYSDQTPAQLPVTLQAAVRQITGESWDGATVRLAAQLKDDTRRPLERRDGAAGTPDQKSLGVARACLDDAVAIDPDMLKAWQLIQTLSGQEAGALAAVLSGFGANAPEAGATQTTPIFPPNGSAVMVPIRDVTLKAASRYTIDTGIDATARLTLLVGASSAVLDGHSIRLLRNGAFLGESRIAINARHRAFALEMGPEPRLVLTRAEVEPGRGGDLGVAVQGPSGLLRRYEGQLTVHSTLPVAATLRVRERPAFAAGDLEVTWSAVSPRARRISGNAIDWLLDIPANSTQPLSYSAEVPAGATYVPVARKPVPVPSAEPPLMKLVNLPHYTEKDDTLKDVAEMYNSQVEWILQVNPTVKNDADLRNQESILVPVVDVGTKK